MFIKIKKLLLVFVFMLCLFGLIGCMNSPINDAKSYVVKNIKTEVTEDLFFITEYKGVSITYSSSNVFILANDGSVNLPLNDELVNLTITFEYNGESDTVIVPLIVRKGNDNNEENNNNENNNNENNNNNNENNNNENNNNNNENNNNDAQTKINEAKNYISTLIPTDVYADLEFKTEYSGVNISYSSSNTAILTNTGQVTKDVIDKDVVLTINFEYQGVTDKYIVYITVKAREKDVEDYVDDIKRDIEATLAITNNVVTKNLTLKTTSLYSSTVKWTSSDENLISTQGVVANNIDSKNVTLSYTITYQGVDYGPFTLDLVVITAKLSYYTSITATSGTALKTQLRSLISSTHKKMTSYNDLRTMTAKTDVDPNNPNNIILFYTRKSVSAKWDGGNTWNREHIWPQSKGWFTTSEAGSDIHHIRPTNPSVNSSRGNTPYGEGSSKSYYEPNDEVKGDVARIIFYLLVRYSQSDSYKITATAQSMEMLLEWNLLDPVDNLERTRNEEAAKIQGNRNPFIDNYMYAEMIWSSAKNLSGEFVVNDIEVIQIEYVVLLEEIKEFEL